MKYLAETLHEINKEKKNDEIEVPQCPNCGEGMVFTFSFPRKEYACLPCGKTDEFLPRNNRILVLEKEHNAKKKLWKKDLGVIAYRWGGATCGKCKNTPRGCRHCRELKIGAADKNYKFEFYLSNNPHKE